MPCICIECQVIKDNGWEYVSEFGNFFENSDFKEDGIYFEANCETQALIYPRTWFKYHEVLQDGTILDEKCGTPLVLTVCSKCFFNYLQDENFDKQH